MKKVLDLFSGIMGFSLGLEATGRFQTIGCCDIEPYAQAMALEKHPRAFVWPDIVKLNDYLEMASKSLPADSPVRIYQQRVRVRGYGTIQAPERPQVVQDYMGNLYEPFAWYDLNTQSWRTWQRCLDGAWESYSQIWPRAGMMRNGIAYQRLRLDSPIIATVSGLLPTPTASDGYFQGQLKIDALVKNYNGGYQISLPSFIAKYFNTLTLPMTYERLMGYPKGYTEIKDVEILSFLKSLK